MYWLPAQRSRADIENLWCNSYRLQSQYPREKVNAPLQTALLLVPSFLLWPLFHVHTWVNIPVCAAEHYLFPACYLCMRSCWHWVIRRSQHVSSWIDFQPAAGSAGILQSLWPVSICRWRDILSTQWEAWRREKVGFALAGKKPEVLFDSATRAERLSRSCATISPNSELLRLLSLKRVLYPHRQQQLFDIRFTLKADRSSANVCIVGISVRD